MLGDTPQSDQGYPEPRRGVPATYPRHTWQRRSGYYEPILGIGQPYPRRSARLSPAFPSQPRGCPNSCSGCRPLLLGMSEMSSGVSRITYAGVLPRQSPNELMSVRTVPHDGFSPSPTRGPAWWAGFEPNDFVPHLVFDRAELSEEPVHATVLRQKTLAGPVYLLDDGIFDHWLHSR